MEILYFGLGMLTVALVYAVVGVFRLRKLFKRVSVRNRKAISSLEKFTEEISREVGVAQDEMYRYIDSRLDKLENRLTNS
jgi:hypothetical protein